MNKINGSMMMSQSPSFLPSRWDSNHQFQKEYPNVGAAPQENYDEHYYMYDDNSEECNFGRPRVEILKKLPDWSVLMVSRGTGPEILMDWILDHVNECFEIKATASSKASTTNTTTKQHNATPEQQKEHRIIPTDNFDPVLANPPSSRYAKSMVLVARNPATLTLLVTLNVTVHGLVKGRQAPQTDLHCKSIMEGRIFTTKACVLDCAQSKSMGNISLIAAWNIGSKPAPRQFRRQLKRGGLPILGNAKDAMAFRGESLCMSMTKLEFMALGLSSKQCFCTAPAPELRQILDREERLWEEREGGLASLKRRLFKSVHPLPTEYECHRSTFCGLEFRVTPAVMIPRQRSEAIIDRIVQYFDKEQKGIRYSHRANPLRPLILDLGTGSGNLLCSILHRLRSQSVFGIGLDSSSEALEIADYNIAALGMKEYAMTVKGKFHHVWCMKNPIFPYQKFSAVVCNPPYYTTRSQIPRKDATMVAHEPKIALFVDGDDHDDDREVSDPLLHYRNILTGLITGDVCYPGALLVFEVFCENASAVADLMVNAGMANVEMGMDSNKFIRSVEGTFPVGGLPLKR